MAQFSSSHGRAMLEHAFEDDSAPDPVTEMEKDHVSGTASRSLRVLTERGGSSVIFHDGTNSKTLFENTNEGELLEAFNTMRANRNAASRVNWSTKGDADAG
jgi:hypothetical protein